MARQDCGPIDIGPLDQSLKGMNWPTIGHHAALAFGAHQAKLHAMRTQLREARINT